MSPAKSKGVFAAVALYGVLAAGGQLWAVAQGRSGWSFDTDLRVAPDRFASLSAVCMGLLLATVVVLGTPVLLRRSRWASELRDMVRSWLAPATRGEVAALAISSGVAEELLFRGAMLSAWGTPMLGLVGSSIVFGALHFGPSAKMWPWAVWAFVMGLAFGAICLMSGSLLGAVFAHVAINWINLHRMLSEPSP